MNPRIPSMLDDEKDWENVSQMTREEAIPSLRRDFVQLNSVMGLEYKGSHFGGFHVRVEGAVLKVTVRIFWEWLTTLVGHQDPGGPWGEQQAVFQSAAERSIPQAWSRKWKFRHPNGTVVEPELVLERAATAEQAHLIFRVHNIHAGAGLRPSDRRVDLFKNDAAMVDDWNTAKSESSGTAVMMNESERIERIFRNVFGANAATLTASARATIGPWTDPGRRCFSRCPGICEASARERPCCPW